jgi:uncharacterized membrane protein
MASFNKWTDQQLEELLGYVLRSGVMLAAVVVVLGGILYLGRYGTSAPNYHVFRGEPTDLRNVSGIIMNTLQFRSRGIIQLGLLLLIATPIARVVLSIIGFIRQRDASYVLVTLIVLFLLLYSLMGGRLGKNNDAFSFLRATSIFFA